MKEIVTSGMLVKIADRQGVQMTDDDAAIVIGYMGGHDYCLLTDEAGNLYRYDWQDGSKLDEEKVEEYSLLEAVEFAAERNGELQDENGDDPKYLDTLRRDEAVLAGLYDSLTCGEDRREYTVRITEHLRKEVKVAASSPEEAEQIVSDRWRCGAYVLEADDFWDVDFQAK